jgi:hypothetical protein
MSAPLLIQVVLFDGFDFLDALVRIPAKFATHS